MSPPRLISPIRSYEELEGGQGREVFFRPHRYRAPELLPVRGEVQLPGTGSTFTYVLHDVSQNGVAFEWPAGGPPFTVGEHLQDVVVRFDSYEAYRGEARVGSVRDVGGVTIVGISFEGLLLAVDEVLHLRSIKLFTESRASSLVPWRVPGHERFKVLVSELQLYLEDGEQQLARLEADLPWHVLHSDGGAAPSPARLALIDQLRRGFVADVIRSLEDIDQAARSAPPAYFPALKEWSRRHVHHFLMQSPVMYRAAQKPFGYPGDYEVMRFIYERPFEGASLFAKSISLVFDYSRAARAVWYRKELVKRRLRELIDSRRKPLRVLSIASGTAQELYELVHEMPDLPTPLEIVLFEQDKGALTYAYRRLKPLVEARWGERGKLVYLHESIKRLLGDPELFTPFGRFDLIYSVGLFDYLRQSTAVQLARNFHARIESGGCAIIGNMAPENPDRWVMEAHLDWQLIYRSRAELLEIGERAAPGAKLRILEEESGVNPFVEICRE
jgi:extracellular factor (EF) 3-hydroxypalmitic acid methyl ester biosynthesis protein